MPRPSNNVILGVVLAGIVLYVAYRLNLPLGAPRATAAGVATLAFCVPAFGVWLVQKFRRKS